METWVLFKKQQFELINNKYNEIDEKIEVLLEKKEEYDQELEESDELNNLREEEYEKIDEKIQVLLEERSEYEEQSEELGELSQENYDNKKNVINTNSAYPTRDKVKLIDIDLIILLMRIIGDKIYTVTSQQNYLYLLFVQYNLLILFYPYFTLSFSLLLIAFILRFVEFITLKLRNDYIDDVLKDYIKIHYPNYYKIKQN